MAIREQKTSASTATHARSRRWVENKFDEYCMDPPDEARSMIDAAREGEFPDSVKDF